MLSLDFRDDPAPREPPRGAPRGRAAALSCSSVPICLRCRRETEAPAPPEPPRLVSEDVTLDLDPAALAAAARDLAPGASRVERVGLEVLGFCPVCGRVLK
jgi:hypothetical protein